MTLTVTGAQPRFGGTCPICKKSVSASRLWDAVLGQDEAGKNHPLHAGCAGGRWRSKVKGAVWQGPDTVEA